MSAERDDIDTGHSKSQRQPQQIAWNGIQGGSTWQISVPPASPDPLPLLEGRTIADGLVMIPISLIISPLCGKGTMEPHDKCIGDSHLKEGLSTGWE